MSGVLETAVEAAHVGFVLLARKLILCGELIAIVGMVGFRLDARLGLSLWPRRSSGRSRASELVAAGLTVLVILYVAFVRDFWELGPAPSFARYGGMSLGAMALITTCGAIWTRGRRGPVDVLGLASLLGIGAVGTACVDAGVRLGFGLLEPLGHLFHVEGAQSAHHGLATVLTGVGALALGLRVWRTSAPLMELRPWDLLLGFALLALVQGFLAFRGVSAIYVLAVPAALAWRAGWRVRLAVGEEGFLARLKRTPQVGSGAVPRRAETRTPRREAV